ncbi:hypothetical protein V3C99_001698 [Haemonchus contortus]
MFATYALLPILLFLCYTVTIGHTTNPLKPFERKTYKECRVCNYVPIKSSGKLPLELTKDRGLPQQLNGSCAKPNVEQIVYTPMSHLMAAAPHLLLASN